MGVLDRTLDRRSRTTELFWYMGFARFIPVGPVKCTGHRIRIVLAFGLASHAVQDQVILILDSHGSATHIRHDLFIGLVAMPAASMTVNCKNRHFLPPSS